MFVGVTVKHRATGVEEIVELYLQESEIEDLRNSAGAVREFVEVLHS